jgi:hypothetical protein
MSRQPPQNFVLFLGENMVQNKQAGMRRRSKRPLRNA